MNKVESDYFFLFGFLINHLQNSTKLAKKYFLTDVQTYVNRSYPYFKIFV